MEFIRLSKIDQQMKEAIQALEEVVRQFDGTHHYGYYDNRFNFNQEMPWLFLAKSDGQVVGVGNIQCESQKDLEVILFVHPDFRRQGIASQINFQIKETLRQYKVPLVSYTSEESFFHGHPQWAQKYLVDLTSDPQWIMEFDKQKVLNLRYPFILKEAQKEQLEPLAHLLSEAFEDSYQEELTFVKQTFLASNLKQYYLADSSQQIFATVSVDYSDRVNYLFAVAVAKRQQGKKMGQELIQRVCQEIMAHSPHLIQLQVEVRNEGAVAMYEKAGFVKKSKVITLIEK